MKARRRIFSHATLPTRSEQGGVGISGVRPAGIGFTGIGLAGSWLIVTLIGTILVAWFGSTLHPRLLLLLPGLVLLLFAGALWPWLSIIGTKAHLGFVQDRIHEHELVEGRLTVRNKAAWPVWGLLLVVDEANRLAIQALRAFSTSDLSFSIQPQQRGHLPHRAPRVINAFPIGLLTASRRVGFDRPLVVWPRVFPVTPSPHWATTDMAVGHVDTRRIGSEGDTIGVREYRRGDPMRWIHWPQTARHDRFMVREFQASGIPRVRIILDCDADVHVGTGADSSFEWSVRIAASLASGWLDDGAEIELLAGTLRIPAAGGQRHRKLILDVLAEVQVARLERRTVVPRSEIATVLISTDLGWGGRDHGVRCGYMLRSEGFGGREKTPRTVESNVIPIASPGEVPAALLRSMRGYSDVA